MTLYQAELKWNIPQSYIKTWIRKRKIPAVKIVRDGHLRYDIPDDFPMPEIEVGSSTVASERAQKAVLRKNGVRGYIAKFAGILSIQRMADFLAISCDKVRWIYDDIVAKGGL